MFKVEVLKYLIPYLKKTFSLENHVIMTKNSIIFLKVDYKTIFFQNWINHASMAKSFKISE